MQLTITSNYLTWVWALRCRMRTPPTWSVRQIERQVIHIYTNCIAQFTCLFRITTLALTHRVIAMYIYFSSGIGIRRKEDSKNSLDAKISCILRWRGKDWMDIQESSGMLSSRNKFSEFGLNSHDEMQLGYIASENGHL